MSEHHLSTHDVLIAGSGPVGLWLACELRLAGASVLVLEQAAESRTPLKDLPFGLRGLSASTIEGFYRRGLLEAVAAEQPPRPAAHRISGGRRPGGHFAGLQFFWDKVDAAAWRYRPDGPTPTDLAVTLQSLEAILAARAGALGVEIRRGAGVEGLEADDEGVTARTAGIAYRGRWLVGCDGGRSVVRKTAGFAFAGTDPEFTGYSLEVELDDPEQLPVGRTYTKGGMYNFTPPGTLALVDFDGGAFHRAQPVTRDHAQEILRRVSGSRAKITALKLATTWTDRAFQAAAYRHGRVLLAGDAAHIHSPLGGQGLNLGLGDAMNLGWKLAATLRGDAPAGLLDSYTAERHPIGAQVLDWSRAQVALMRPSRASRALAAIVQDVMETSDGATYFAERVWGVGLRYDVGESHPLAGRSAPDFAFTDGTRLGRRLGDGRGLLLDFDADAPLRALAGRYGDRMGYAATLPVDALGLRALFIRPDGVVAWATDAAPQREEAAHAVARWFGPA